MLSTAYRLRLEEIAERIARHEEVGLDDIMWAQKLAAHNAHAAKILRQARRAASTPTMQEGDMDDFLNQLDLGSPDPTRHKTGFNSVDDIVDFFSEGDDKPEDWRQRD
jgi:hypothetical protein